MNVPEAAPEAGERHRSVVSLGGRVLKQLGATSTDCVEPPLSRFELRYKLDEMASQTLSNCGRKRGAGEGSNGWLDSVSCGNA